MDKLKEIKMPRRVVQNMPEGRQHRPPIEPPSPGPEPETGAPSIGGDMATIRIVEEHINW